MNNIFYFIKKVFRCRDIQMVAFPPSALFLTVSHGLGGSSKINLKFYDVVNCLNKNLMTHFASYLGKEKGMTLYICPLIEY